MATTKSQWCIALLSSAALWGGACKNEVRTVDETPGAGSLVAQRLATGAIERLDLLVVVDNSRSMADKQELLSVAVPELVAGLTNPPCLLEDGTQSPQQPSDALAECPVPGSTRQFDPILDIHIGIISSSIGSHGADACDTSAMMSLSFSVDDKAHLIHRAGTQPGAPVVPTYQDRGFLVWDPDAQSPSHNPQGETDLGNLNANLAQMIVGAGEVGCGYEAPLEAWYRFLVDPTPYANITVQNNAVVLEGIDEVIVGTGPTNPGQRQLFLRPDSLLAILMLSDENDCSIRDGGQYYFASQIFQPGTNTPYHLPKPRAACAVDPNDPCCRSCGQNPGDGCDTSADDCSGALSNLEDHINLRCFDQKRRFGIDFMWPIDRYVGALTEFQVTDRDGNVADNPLFTDLVPGDSLSAVRDPSRVVIAGIVGVPWQDIARRDENGLPNLFDGLDAAGRYVGGFQSGAEMAPNGTWDVILGDSSCYATDASCLPTDPHMIESIEPRSGQNPITGDPISPPGSLSSNINGNEYTINLQDDLQYACVFDLSEPRDCSMPGGTCECSAPDNPWGNPLCDGQLQVRAKAYPGIRQLEVLQGMGDRGIVGSICAAQRSNVMAADFGYRPAMMAVHESVKKAFSPPCLPAPLDADADGRVSCRVIETLPECSATCASEARSAVVDADAVRDAIAEVSGGAVATEGCLCEVNQLDADGLLACQDDTSDVPASASGAAVHGWCYIDATAQPPIGNLELVVACPASDRRTVRVVGEGAARSGASLWLVCDEG